jgi:hypothetical protein
MVNAIIFYFVFSRIFHIHIHHLVDKEFVLAMAIAAPTTFAVSDQLLIYHEDQLN